MTWTDRSAPGARVLKADAVHVRGTDPATVPVETRLTEAAETAYGQGYDDGFAAGALAAGAQLAEAADRVAATLAAGLARLGAEGAARRQADAARLVELALAVAEWAVRRELASVPEAFFGRLEEVLADRDRRARVEISVAPDLVEATRAWLAAGGAGETGTDAVSVTGDAELEVGEARVSIDDSTVFATFADAFEQAREVLEARPPLDEDDDEVVEVLYDIAAVDGTGVPAW